MNNYSFNNLLKGVIATIVVIALSCCGSKKQVKPLVEQFLTDNLKENNFSNLSVEKLDSTFFITDSLLTDLQQKSAKNPLLRSDFRYPKTMVSKKKYFVKVKYNLPNGKEQNQTFYIDEHLEHVIAFKDNMK